MTTFLLSLVIITGLQSSPSDADANVHRLALRLTAEGLTVGIVTERAIFDDEDRLTDVTPRSSPTALVAAFNQAQADHRATLTSGAALIRASYVPQRVLHALETRHKNIRIAQPNVELAFAEVAYLLNPERKDRGVVGAANVEGCAPNIAVTINGDDLSTVDVLNALVRQVPGLTWLMLYDDGGQSDWLGFMCGDGQTVRLSVDFH